MVETVRNTRACAARHIVHGATRYQPHHQFDAFGAGLANIVNMRQLRQPGRIGDKPVQKRGVEFLVDQPRARALSWWLIPPVPQICTLSGAS